MYGQQVPGPRVEKRRRVVGYRVQQGWVQQQYAGLFTTGTIVTQTEGAVSNRIAVCRVRDVTGTYRAGVRAIFTERNYEYTYCVCRRARHLLQQQ